MNLSTATIQKYLVNYSKHTQTLSTGGKLIHVYGRVYDYFHGTAGWMQPSRFKLREHRDGLTGYFEKKFEHLSGYEISPKLQATILSEMIV
jgi:hypothetical protein